MRGPTCSETPVQCTGCTGGSYGPEIYMFALINWRITSGFKPITHFNSKWRQFFDFCSFCCRSKMIMS